ncbi:MAG: hypothetical protein EOO70_06575 [Myxococcaceae bacterium]|nr:MAG: hypothetical protein EOO70_06575 [Myxococcaceae bacterium]
MPAVECGSAPGDDQGAGAVRALGRPGYASVGVGWLWFVDPEHRTLEAHENDAGTWRPLGRWQDEGQVEAPPFAAAGWALVALWG